MKRKISIILTAVILIMSVFSVNAFAAAPKTDALLDRLETATEVSVTLKSGETNLFGVLPADVTNTFTVKGNKVCYDYNAGFLSARIVANDDGIYGYLPVLPFFYVKMDVNPLKGANVWEMVMSAADLTQALTRYLGSSEETVDGTKYYVETYDDRENVESKFYYIGDDLKMLIVTDKGTNSVQYTYFENISFKVDDSVFEIPATAIDLSPVLKSLFISMFA